MRKIKITSAVAIDGKVLNAGKTPTVDAKLAASLIRRGKAVAVLPGAEDEMPIDAVEPEAVKPARAAKKGSVTNAG